MGGVEAYLVGLATILEGRAEVYALCVLPDLEKSLRASGVRVSRLPLVSRLRALRFVLSFFSLTWLIVRHRIDIVQVNGLLESVLLLPARLLACEAIYTRHGPFELDVYSWYRQPFKYLPRLISRYSANFASRLICVSETVGSVCRPLFPKDRVTVISNWVSNIPEFRGRTVDKSGLIRIIYIGRLERYKGVQLVLEAMRGLPGASLTVVGDGSYREALQALASGMNVRFVGFHKDPSQFYRQADIFVMPSLGPEGLPLVTLEAMSHGLPCLFSDLPVHDEITDGGRTAMLFRSGDVRDLLAKLEVLVSSGEERARLSRDAYRMVQQRYHESIAARAYLQIFAQGTESPVYNVISGDI